MEKEKVKKPFYKKWWVWVIAIIVIGGIATSGGDDEEKANEPETETASAETDNKDEKKEEKKKKEEKTEFGIDEKAEIDGQTVVVSDIEKSQGSDFDKPKDGNEYVIVTVEIENNGDKEISYNPLNFKMKNSNGQIVDMGLITVDSDTSLSSGDLAPGGNVSGTVSFEQPKDDEGLQLIFEPGFWSGKQITFNLQ